MKIQKYINQKKELQSKLIELLENPNPSDQDIENLINFNTEQKYLDNQEELKYLLQLLLNISNHHHRIPNFLNIVNDILQYLEEPIKKTFSNNEIFNIFKSSKPILLFLIQKKILLIDDTILQYWKSDKDETDYYQFLFPEIKDNLSQIAKEKINKETANWRE